MSDGRRCKLGPAANHGPDRVPAHGCGRGRHPPLPGQGEERQRLRALDVPGERHHVSGNAAGAASRADGDRRQFLGDRAELERPAGSGSSAITGYRIEASSTRTGGWTDLVANTGNTRTTYQDTGLSPNTTATTGSRRSTPSGREPPRTSTATSPELSVPDAPRRLTAQARGISVIELAGRGHRPAERPGDRLPDPVVEHGNRRMERSRGRHGQHAHHLPGHGPRRRTRPATTGSRRSARRARATGRTSTTRPPTISPFRARPGASG